MTNNNTQTNPNNQNNGYQSTNNTQNQNAGKYNYNVPKKRSTGSLIVAIILILMGTSYIVDTFLPWVFDWLDSGLIIAGVAIFAGFALLIKR